VNKIKYISIAVTALLLSATGCYKVATYVPPDTGEVVTKTVSFEKDIQPILTANCALSGCHAAGGRTPNLSKGNAYNSLIKGSFVDKAKPASSIIYKRLTGVLTPSMPLGANSNPSNINGLMLAWITQGCKNN
jgi:hypothetical protein